LRVGISRNASTNRRYFDNAGKQDPRGPKERRLALSIFPEPFPLVDGVVPLVERARLPRVAQVQRLGEPHETLQVSGLR